MVRRGETSAEAEVGGMEVNTEQCGRQDRRPQGRVEAKRAKDRPVGEERGRTRGPRRLKFRGMTILFVLGQGIEPTVLKHNSKCSTTVPLDIRNLNYVLV